MLGLGEGLESGLINIYKHQLIQYQQEFSMNLIIIYHYLNIFTIQIRN